MGDLVAIELTPRRRMRMSEKCPRAEVHELALSDISRYVGFRPVTNRHWCLAYASATMVSASR